MAKVLMSSSISGTASRSKITLDDLLRRWGKFDEVELKAITSNAHLVTQVQAKYGLDAKQAQTNVDLWAKGREL
jgi:hypothetical protein